MAENQTLTMAKSIAQELRGINSNLEDTNKTLKKIHQEIYELVDIIYKKNLK